MDRQHMGLRDILLTTIAPMLWGVGFTFAKPALDHFPPIFMMFLIYLLVAVCLSPVLRNVSTGLTKLVVLSFFNTTLQSSLIFSGLADLPASLSVLAVQSQVPFAVLAAVILGVDKLSKTRFLGVAIAFSGIALLTGVADSLEAPTALALVLLGALSWGVGQALTRRYSSDGSLKFTAAISVVGAPQLLVASLLLEDGQMSSLLLADAWNWWAILVVGIGGFLLGYIIWFHQLTRFRVDQVTPFILMMPLFGVIASVMLLGETITDGFLISGCVVIAGLSVVHFGDGAAILLRRLLTSK